MITTFKQTKEIIDILLELTDHDRTIDSMYLNGNLIYALDDSPEGNALHLSNTYLLKAYYSYDDKKDSSILDINFSKYAKFFLVARGLRRLHDYLRENEIIFAIFEEHNSRLILL